MTSARPRSGIIRQQSLQQQTPKRAPLRKQLSEEQITPMIANESGLKISLPPKNKTKPNSSSGPRARAAWIEKKQNSADNVEVVAKKCEQHRQSRMLLTCDKDMLYTRQELAERLRKAWRDREKGKQNLDIFLAPNTQIQDVMSDIEQSDTFDAVENVISASVTPTKSNFKINSPKIMSPPVKPEGVYRNRPSTAPKPMKALHFNVEQKENEVEVPVEGNIDAEGVNNVTLTPMTAAMRRSSFQNQSRQSAFNATVDKPRPPLQRALSNPVPSPVPKEEEAKLSQNKRKLKTRRRFNKDKDGGESSEDENKMSPENKSRGRRGLARSRSVAGAEVVTMVSLISPTASDSESDDKKTKQIIINNAKSIAIRNTPNPLPYAQAQKRLASLRKSGKSVSFQDIDDAILPPGNPTGRCLSAMLSLRRGSMAPRSMARASSASTVRNFSTRLTAGDQDELEYQNDENDYHHDGPPTMNVDPEDRVTDTRDAEAAGVDCAMIFRISKSNAPSLNPVGKNSFSTKSTGAETGNEDINKISGDSEIPTFYSQKEKECWQMYQRMLTKGVVVAYDTILRGMLTPTEYRLRKKCEEKDNLEKLEMQKENLLVEESEALKDANKV